MKLEDLRPAPGAKTRRKRVGRGPGSGHGKTATKGSKGHNARSGGGKSGGFEGGQMPLYRRLPQRGVLPDRGKSPYALLNPGAPRGFSANAGGGSPPPAHAGLIKGRHRARVKDLGTGGLPAA